MDELLASISRLQGGEIVRALQALLQQAQSTLKPSNVANKARPSLYVTPAVDKRALARGILVLLDHAAVVSAAAQNSIDYSNTTHVNVEEEEELREAVVEALADGMQRQPWLWELFWRRHMEDLMQRPGAATLLSQALACLEPTTQAKGWATLSAQLQQQQQLLSLAALSVGPAAVAVLAALHFAAKEVVGACLQLVSSGLEPFGAANAGAEVHVTLLPALPPALQVLLDLEERSFQAGDATVSAYAVALLGEMGRPEAVHRMLQLGSGIRQSSKGAGGAAAGGGAEGAAAPRLGAETVQMIHTASHTAGVLIEAAAKHPQLVPDHLSGKSTAIAALLAVRWELAQLAQAGGGARPRSKASPRLWHLSTCGIVLDILLDAPASLEAPALALPPAVASHALETIHGAVTESGRELRGGEASENSSLAGGSSSGSSLPASEPAPALMDFLARVMRVQEACFKGVVAPHAAVHAGPAYHAAISTSRHLHSLLIAEGQQQQQMGKDGLEPGGLRKRGGGSAARNGGAGQEKRRKKSGGKGGTGQDAVADVLRLLTAPAAMVCVEVKSEAGATGEGGSDENAAAPSPAKRRIMPQKMAPEPAAAAEDVEVKAEKVEAEGEYGGEAPLPVKEEAGGQPVGKARGFGRVMMSSSLHMEESEREAMWQAYIADKEKLVDLLGDSAYQEWYDEGAHPVPAAAPRHADVDAAFDAIFGSAGDGAAADGSGNGGFFLPQTVLQTSIVNPAQAALAAALQVVRAVAESAVATTPLACHQVYGSLTSAGQRRNAVREILKSVEKNHGAGIWMSSAKSAEVHAAGGTLLHFVAQLRDLLYRTARRTTPPTLAAYVALASAALSAAEEEDRAAVAALSAGSRVAQWMPLRYVGSTVRSFLTNPPLMAAALDAATARALPRLAAVGAMEATDAATYAAAVLWLVLRPTVAAAACPKPEWLTQNAPEAGGHPFVSASASILIKSAGVEQLLKLLADSAGEALEECREDATVALPLMDSCAAAAMRLSKERSQAATAAAAAADQARFPEENGAAAAALVTSPTIILGTAAEAHLAALIEAICGACVSVAKGLTVLLDGEADSLAAIESHSSFLGLGSEFMQAVRAVGDDANGLGDAAATRAAAAAIEQASDLQTSCLELMRSMKGQSPLYVAGLRGLEAAPALVLPTNTDGCSEVGDGAADAVNSSDLDVEGPGGSQGVVGGVPAGGAGGGAQAAEQRSAYQRRKRLQDIQNPYLRAIVAESRRAAGEGADGELSELEDFIVANPERNYGNFIEEHFPMATSSEEDSESDNSSSSGSSSIDDDEESGSEGEDGEGGRENWE